MSEQTSYGGPTIHRSEPANAYELAIRIIKANEGLSREEVEALFIEAVKEEGEAFINAGLRYFFINHWNYFQKSNRPQPQPKPQPKPKTPEEEMAEQERMAKAVADRVKDIKQAVILSEMLMPNGKPVGKCSGTEMGKFGRFGLAIEKVVGTNIVENVLDEEGLHKILNQL